MNSPSLKLNKKILGTIQCQIKSFSADGFSFIDLGSFSVIDIVKSFESELIYICDTWDGENPQEVSQKYVKEFIPQN